MTTAAPELPSPIDTLLDRVEHALLSAGVVRPLRHSLLENLQADILRRVPNSSDAPPAPQDVAKTLEQLGLSSTASSTAPSLASPEWRRYIRALTPRRSRCALWGVFCIALSLLPFIALLIFLNFFSPAGIHIETYFPHDQLRTHIGNSDTDTITLLHAIAPDGYIRATISNAPPFTRFLWLFAPLSPLALAATLLGLVALIDIRRYKGRITGQGAALFAFLFYPILISLIALWLW